VRLTCEKLKKLSKTIAACARQMGFRGPKDTKNRRSIHGTDAAWALRRPWRCRKAQNKVIFGLKARCSKRKQLFY
jgi:hypothetical protein